MVITGLSLKIEKIPLRTPFVTALRRVDHVENIILTLHTDTALVGEGAAPATKAVTGEDLESISDTVRNKIFPSFYGHSFDLEKLVSLTHHSCGGNNSAKAAVEIALYDLASRLKNQNLAEFLGGGPIELKTAVTISLNKPEVMAKDAATAFARGFNILKIKVGGNDGMDIERIKAVHKAAPKAKLLVDANQAWDAKESLSIIAAVENLDIKLIEQPVNGKDTEGLKFVTKNSDIPILADEAVFTLEDAKKIIDQNAADMINIKLMKCGGISKAIEIIQYCRSYNVKCMMGSMLEGPVSITAAAQLIMAYPDVFSYIDLDSPLLYEKIPSESEIEFFNNTLSLKKHEPYYVYIVKCSDDTYYTGIAKDIEKRILEHNGSKKGARYTRIRRPVELVYKECHKSKSSALKREMEIKKMARAQKEKLIGR